ncbi:MAG TPA: hypothetical protein VLB68_24025, partial [Pyrinomonadaceae bacterium]|nr:hypothetical protein [Pyrinomonadaceae bacterium]
MSTIVALSTPPGRGAVAIVRISGPSALRIIGSLLKIESDLEPRKASLRKIFKPDSNDLLDLVLITTFP